MVRHNCHKDDREVLDLVGVVRGESWRVCERGLDSEELPLMAVGCWEKAHAPLRIH